MLKNLIFLFFIATLFQSKANAKACCGFSSNQCPTGPVKVIKALDVKRNGVVVQRLAVGDYVYVRTQSPGFYMNVLHDVTILGADFFKTPEGQLTCTPSPKNSGEVSFDVRYPALECGL